MGKSSDWKNEGHRGFGKGGVPTKFQQNLRQCMPEGF